MTTEITQAPLYSTVRFRMWPIDVCLPDNHPRPLLRVGLRLGDQFADQPGDVAFAEQEETERGSQWVFVIPAEMNFRRFTAFIGRWITRER